MVILHRVTINPYPWVITPLFQIREKQGGNHDNSNPSDPQNFRLRRFMKTSFECSKSAAGEFFWKWHLGIRFLHSEIAFLEGFWTENMPKHPNFPASGRSILSYYPPLFQIREKQGGVITQTPQIPKIFRLRRAMKTSFECPKSAAGENFWK